MDTDSQPHTPASGDVRAAITDGLVRVYADKLGHGPTRARTVVDKGLVVCVLRDVGSPADHVLIDAGQEETVRGVRERLRGTIADELVRVVEEATGTAVSCFLSDYQPSADTAALVFLLETD
jgi:uncharacterized protein YbcI